MTRWSVVVVLVLIGITLGLGIALHALAVDDAFITYRYAQNLAAGRGLVYNAGQPVLSTTAPLWALILAGGALLWPDIPAMANALSAIALGIGAVLLFFLARGERASWPGLLAASLYVLYPLLWLSLGLETATFLALALGAILAYRRGHLYRTAILLALATLTRADGLILAAVLATDYVLPLAGRHIPTISGRLPESRAEANPMPPELGASTGTGRASLPGLRPRRQADGSLGMTIREKAPVHAIGAALLYVAVMLPLLAWLIWRFGSPLPATLAAKRAQAGLGITGFYAHTTYLQGLGTLARARLAQSPLYVLFAPAAVVGLLAMWRQAGWVRLLAAWAAAHLLGYALLGVTPYYWYYAPLVPGLVSVSALGIVASGRWLARREGHSTGKPITAGGPAAAGPPLLRLREMGRVSLRGTAWLWAAALLLALVQSDVALVRSLDGPLPPPDNVVSKVLPEAKVGVYRQAGRWLQENSDAAALVGVTEVGIIGYYARRPMVDFLGLLQPDVAQALNRGDLSWALLDYQPDYLALTAGSPLYAYDLRADPWFQAAYTPVQAFADPRFWGSPLTIYRRQVPRQVLPEPAANGLPTHALPLNVDLGGQIRLLGAVSGTSSVQPGGTLALTIYWQALGPIDRDYTAFVHLLGRYDRVVAQRDAPPGLGAQPTRKWKQGQVIADPYLLALPEAAYAPDEAVWEVGLYEAHTGRRLARAGGGDNVRFGTVTIRPAARPLYLDFGPVALTGYSLDPLALTPGQQLHVTLHWEGTGPADVRVRLVSEQGEVAAQADGDAGQATYALTLPATAPAGAYDLEVLVVDPAMGQPLPLRGADGQPRGDRAQLTKVRLYR